jgi:monoamine oxidase
MAPTMMQPVGGMGRIGQAFYQRLQRRIRLNAQVTEIRRTPTAARVVWKDTRRGVTHEEIASMVAITIPLTVLRSIPADFSPAIQAAIAAPSYVPAGKVAFQAERRFWELDQQIYGGISWTSRDITQIWYPTAGLHQPKGILVGAYIWSEDIGDRFAALPPDQRLQNALADGEHLHPNYGRSLRNGVSIAWKNIPFSQGAWADWTRADRATHYQTLLRGEGPFLFAGEHLSYITGWQEGAVQSAHAALKRIGGRA